MQRPPRARRTITALVFVCTRVYDAYVDSKRLIKELIAAGWVLDRVKGSHNTFRHPDKRHAVTVPHPKKDLSIGLVKAIRKQAGLP